MAGCGWNFKRSGWNFGVELDQLSLPYIIVLKSFVVNFLDKKLSRFFIKLLSRFFRRLLLSCCFFFFSKTMCLVVNPERRWQPRAGGRRAMP